MSEAGLGERFGNYEALEKLGEGGMGVVYLAEHPIIKRRVALKVLRPELGNDAEAVARFFAEARAVNAIGHDSIVEIHDLGETPAGLRYFTMELLQGESLRQRLRRDCALRPAKAIAIAAQVADALSAAHARGITHRDIKPENIFLAQRSGRSDFVKVLDFGAAKLTGALAATAHKTRTGAAVGTPSYMSPEQCMAKGGVDHRTDIYALGAVLFEMITGRLPLGGDDIGEVMVRLMAERPPHASDLVPGLPPALDAAIARALEKRPEDRFASMEEFRVAFCAALPGQDARRGPGPAVRAQRASAFPAPPRAAVPPVRLTTNSRAASEVFARPSLKGKGPRRAWLLATLAAVALATVAGGALLLGRRPLTAPTAPAPVAMAPTTVSAAAEPAPRPPDAAVATEAPSPSPGASAAYRTVRLRVASRPRGAIVRRRGVKDALGRTPLDIVVPAGTKPIDLLLEKPGYQDHAARVTPEVDTQLQITLRRQRRRPAVQREKGLFIDL